MVARITSPSTRPVSSEIVAIEISSIPKSLPEPPVLDAVLPLTIPKTADVIGSFPAYQSYEYLTQLQVVEVMAAKSVPTLVPLTVKYNWGKLLELIAVAQKVNQYVPY